MPCGRAGKEFCELATRCSCSHTFQGWVKRHFRTAIETASKKRGVLGLGKVLNRVVYFRSWQGVKLQRGCHLGETCSSVGML